MKQNKITYTTELITPQIAQEMLTYNTMNRKVSQHYINHYAAAMKRGEWKLNGEAILLAEDGTLIDGQHRLYAVIKAGIPVLFTVGRGVDKTAFCTINKGKTRSDGDVFSIDGIPNSTAVAALVRRAMALKCTNRTVFGTHTAGSVGNNFYITSSQLLAEYKANKEAYESSLSVGNTYYKKYKILAKSEICALYYHLAFIKGHSVEKVTAFLDAVYGYRADIPVASWLHEYLVKDMVNRARHLATTSPKCKMQYIVRSWNSYILGRNVKSVRWKDGDNIETFI